MATNTQKISGSVPEKLYDALIAFKSERGLKTVSEALQAVLQEFFAPGSAPESRLEMLEAEMVAVTEHLGALTQAIAIIATRIDLMEELPLKLPVPDPATPPK